jgi:hypothetical protein
LSQQRPCPFCTGSHDWRTTVCKPSTTYTPSWTLENSAL